jgi:hypothetical protein
VARTQVTIIIVIVNVITQHLLFKWDGDEDKEMNGCDADDDGAGSCR